ncbi:hypothetical protein Taro_000115 [Colocasia esculenta]|uniref:Uncharacterized protein n=1 Tax=Colocasia esculenta TaxID=4460 RepID=A0A843T9U3_COLES|nr:hypothetical protein [Colocasia esculenta]
MEILLFSSTKELAVAVAVVAVATREVVAVVATAEAVAGIAVAAATAAAVATAAAAAGVVPIVEVDGNLLAAKFLNFWMFDHVVKIMDVQIFGCETGVPVLEEDLVRSDSEREE